MGALEDLSNRAIGDYKKLIDSELFTEEQLGLWLQAMVDKPELKQVVLSERQVAKMTNHACSTLCRWRRDGIVKGTQFGYDADNIIKIMKISRVKDGKIVWR